LNAFVDSGGWISVVDEGDAHHEAGSAYLGALMDLHVRLLTTDFVLDEVVTRLRYDVGHAKAAEFLALVRASVDRHILEIVHVDADLWARAEAIFLRYRDARLSFTDCTSFALLAERPVDEVFGFDAHFEMMGHVLQPKSPD
jgi:predicted nucleic acid-binding protein